MSANTPQPSPSILTCLNPYIAGILLGLALLAAFLVLGTGIGASGGIARIAARTEIGRAHV